MLKYLTPFAADDRERIFRFFALFSRCEYALKREGFFRPGRHHNEALADWNAFANELAPKLAVQADAPFTSAQGYLLAHPPRQQVVVAGEVRWEVNPRRGHETDAQYLLRVVRDVRNNLFHGGKYPHPYGAVEEIARDRTLIEAATTVLERCLLLHDAVRGTSEAAP
jgi:hypothetical protein